MQFGIESVLLLDKYRIQICPETCGKYQKGYIMKG